MRLTANAILAGLLAGCGGLLDEDLGVRLFAIGAYIGELIQRVMKRYRNRAEDGIAAYVASVTADTS